MTNSYKLSQSPLPRIIIIHGMNNNRASFDPLKKYFENLGDDIHFLTLPGHGEDRNKARNFEDALALFSEGLDSLTGVPYIVVAFSHGALYFQHWLKQHETNRPLLQVLLAPALFVRKENFVFRLFSILPKNLWIKSVAPKRFQRYQFLRVWEYNILLSGMKFYQKDLPCFLVPTLILIDPKDELVDAQKLEKHVLTAGHEQIDFQFWQRDYLNIGIGQHHILFHPDYFSSADWKHFTDHILGYLQKQLKA